MQGAANARTEQQARWLLWQMEGVTVEGGERPAPREAAPSAPPPDVRRSRYDAVIRRMQQAGQRTGTYTPWA